jgi:hypothetical protein
MEDLRARLASGASSFDWDARHLTRAMDHDGIYRGEWYSDASDIKAALRRWIRLSE